MPVTVRAKIAAHFGCSPQAVSKLLRRYFDIGLLKEANRTMREILPPSSLDTAPTPVEEDARTERWRGGMDLRLAIRLKRAGLTWDQICRSNGIDTAKADALRQRTVRFAEARGLETEHLRRKA